MITIERCPCPGNAHWIVFVTNDGRATEPTPNLAVAKNAINVFVKDGEASEDEANDLRAQLASYGLAENTLRLSDEEKAEAVDLLTNIPSEEAEKQIREIVEQNLMTQEDADEIRALVKKRRETPFTDEELLGLPEAIAAIGGVDGEPLLAMFLKENRITPAQADRIRAKAKEFRSNPIIGLLSVLGIDAKAVGI